MTEDPRQTRGNGPDPRTAQSRSASSGGGSSRHVRSGLPSARAGLRQPARPQPRLTWFCQQEQRHYAYGGDIIFPGFGIQYGQIAVDTGQHGCFHDWLFTGPALRVDLPTC